MNNSIHLKIEAKKNFKSFIYICDGLNGASTANAIYNTFLMLHGVSYQVQKLSKRAKRNLI